MDKKAKIEELIDKALQYYDNRDFAKEIVVWREVCEIEKENPFWEHNLALALMNNGEYGEALDRFNTLIEKYPPISRIQNNFAVLLLRMGVAYSHELIPIFVNALILSESPSEFVRHFLNLCNSIAYGLDSGAKTLFDEIDKLIPDIVKKTHPIELADKNIIFMRQVLECMRYISTYREAFSYRKWSDAQNALENAKSKFLSLGLKNLANGLENNVQLYFKICRDVVALLEAIGSEKNITPREILSRANLLHERAVSLVNSESHHARLLNILGWFLVGLIELLKFLDDLHAPIEESSVSVDAISELSSQYFSKIGNELITIVNFIEKQCVDLKNQLNSIANDNQKRLIAEKTWSRIALYCNGVILEFKEIDTKLCKGILGWDNDPLELSISEMWEFKSLVERQLYKDIFVGGRPQENIGRALLQAFLTSRSYREVPIRGGRSDIITFSKEGRFIYETKIWRGADYFEQGLNELEEYIKGEDDGNLRGSFYIVFDPTESARLVQYIRGSYCVRTVGKYQINIFAIQTRLPIPSNKPKNQ